MRHSRKKHECLSNWDKGIAVAIKHNCNSKYIKFLKRMRANTRKKMK